MAAAIHGDDLQISTQAVSRHVRNSNLGLRTRGDVRQEGVGVIRGPVRAEHLQRLKFLSDAHLYTIMSPGTNLGFHVVLVNDGVPRVHVLQEDGPFAGVQQLHLKREPYKQQATPCK